MPPKLTYKEFKERLVHPDKYDYSILTKKWFNKNYKNLKTKIPIKCKNCNQLYYPKLNDHINTKGGCQLGCWGNRSKKLSFKEFKEKIKDYLNENNYELLIDDQWWNKNYKSKRYTIIKILDKNINSIFPMKVANVIIGHRNPNIIRKRILMSFEEFLKKTRHRFKSYYILINKQWWNKNYKSMKTKIPIKCKKHKKVIFQSVSTFISGKNDACKICGYIKAKRTYQSYIKEFSKLFPDYEFEKLTNNEFHERYKHNYDTYIKVKCHIHGWFTKSLVGLKSNSGCPKCSIKNKSKGEKIIQNFLEKYNINYINEYKLPESQTRLDFYFPKYNIGIEYDGIQHFKPIDFAGRGETWARQSFIKNKKRDFLKNKLCHIYKINLIRIPYFIKDLDEYLIKILKREKILKEINEYS